MSLFVDRLLQVSSSVPRSGCLPARLDQADGSRWQLDQAMSGCCSFISAETGVPVGLELGASIGGVTGMIRRLSAGGRPSIFAEQRSVVITSEVRVTRSS